MPVRRSSPDLVPLIIADVYELAGLFRRNGEGIARGVGQTQARWQVLSAASDGPKTVPQIARRLGVTRQNVQRIADLLVADGLARYAANPDHLGSPHLVLADKGHRTLARLTRAGRSLHAALARRLADVDLERLRGDLHAARAAAASVKRSSGENDDD